MEEPFKEVLLDCMQAPVAGVDIDFKAEILHTIHEQGFHSSKEYLSNVVAAVSYIDHERVTSGLRRLIAETETDEHIDYLKSVTTVVAGTQQRKHQTKDNYMTGERGYFRTALLNLVHPQNQVYALQVFLEHEDGTRLEHNDLVKLTHKMAECYKDANELYEYTIAWLIKALEYRRTTF